jgi:hypothetical protein
MEDSFESLARDYMLDVEIKASMYDDKLKHLQALFVFNGILCQMESDVLLYRSKHGNTEKIKPAMKRAENLREVYDHLSGLFDQNEQYRILFKKNHARTYNLEKELEEERTKNLNIEEWTSE